MGESQDRQREGIFLNTGLGLAGEEGLEAVGDVGFFIGKEGGFLHGLPAGGGYFREEGVGTRGDGLNYGDLQAVGQGEGLGIDLGASDYESLCLAGVAGHGEGGFQGGCGLCAGEVGRGIVGQDDVPAVGEGAFGKGGEGLASHYYGMAGGQGFEAAQVGGDVEGQVSGPAYRVVGGYGGYYGCFHRGRDQTETVALMWGRGS